jgi:tripeptidyl-peptidase-1
VNGAIVYCKDPILKGGTSMSTPLVAAIFTRINDERLAVGKSPIGFVNPTLYANPQIFNDITVGDQSLGSSYFQLQNCFSQRSGKLGAISEATAKLSSRNSSLALLTLTPTNFLFTVLTKIDLDPVTGLGTPKYDAWLKVFMALP